MRKMTTYLPDELDGGLERLAAETARSETELVVGSSGLLARASGASRR